MITRLVDILCCPSCYNSLQERRGDLECSQCNVSIPIIDGIPRFYQTTTEKIIEFDSTLLDIGAGASPFSKLLEPFKTYKVDFKPYKG